MLKEYEEWVNAFIGEKPKIKIFNGKTLFSKLSGLKNSYAYYQYGSKNFGYNSTLMDDMDEADIIAIAAHEAGHYWGLNKNYKLVVEIIAVELYLMIAILISMIFAIISALIFMMIIIYHKRKINYIDEMIAEKFVLKTIGPAMSLNTTMTLIGNYLGRSILNKHPRLDMVTLNCMIEALKELNINYVDSNES